MGKPWTRIVVAMGIAFVVAVGGSLINHVERQLRDAADGERIALEIARREQEEKSIEAEAEAKAKQVREEAAAKEVEMRQPRRVNQSEILASLAAPPEEPIPWEPPHMGATLPLPARPEKPLLAPSIGRETPRECQYPGAIGTSRILTVGTEGGVTVGFKTYPRGLPLADHEVVLTFDDGPLPETTPRILDTLKENCVQATFFPIGKHSASSPALVRREIAEGHTVGHHTWSHPDVTLRGMSDPEARAEIDNGFAANERAGWGTDGQGALHVPFFRFPGFADTKPLVEWLEGRNIAIFGCDIWVSDWVPMTPQAQLSLAISQIEKVGRGIILLHDTRQQTAAMLPSLLSELKARGYRIVHIVPGRHHAETVEAQPGWTSETEEIIAQVLPKVLARTGKAAGQNTAQDGGRKGGVRDVQQNP